MSNTLVVGFFLKYTDHWKVTSVAYARLLIRFLDIAELLDDAKIDVLVYNGDRDMACCAQGSEAVLDNLEWNGAGEWKQAERFLWLVKDEMAGYVKSSGNLTFAICFNSGHMFPTNQPENALDLVTRFIRRQSFADVKTPDFADYDPNSLVGDGEEHQITTAAPQFVRRFGGFWVQHILDLLVGFVAGIGIGFGLARRNIPQNEYISIPDVELEPSH